MDVARKSSDLRTHLDMYAIPDQIGIWKCYFLWRGENQQSTQRNTSQSKGRTNNKLNANMMLGPGIKSRAHWLEVSTLNTTALPHLPVKTENMQELQECKDQQIATACE